MPRYSTSITAALFVALVSAGCASSNPAAVVPADDARAQAFSEVFSKGYSADYDPVATTRELGDISQTVVTGTIKSIQTGRTFAMSADDPTSSTTVVLVLTKTAVLSGEANNDSAEVYIELPAPFQMDSTEFAQLLPVGASTIAYLESAATAEQTPILDPDAGRPAGVTLWQLISPQGMFMQTTFGSLEVITGQILPDVQIPDLAPDKSRQLPAD